MPDGDGDVTLEAERLPEAGDSIILPAARTPSHDGVRLTPSTGRLTPSRFRWTDDLRTTIAVHGAPYTVNRSTSVSQVDVAVQVDSTPDTAETVLELVDQIGSDMPSVDKKYLWYKFASVNTDLSGSIGTAELVGLLKDFDPTATQQDLEGWVAQLNTPGPGDSANGEGEITFIEFLDWWDRGTQPEAPEGPGSVKKLQSMLMQTAWQHFIYK
eukprot:Sspe_Gene.98968::Locus_72366_Transcript_1_1_Confidence_1.000_Length_703::g.98968::m.98968